MATTKLYLDTRTTLNDGNHQLKLGVSYKSIRTLLPLGIKLSCKQFNGQSVVAHPKKDFYNAYIKKRVADVEVAMLELATQGKLRNITAGQLKKLLMAKMSPMEEESVKYLYIDAMAKKILGKKPRTIEIYENTKKRVEQYCESRNMHINSLSLLDITKEWLTMFEMWAIENGDQINTISIDMRNIRAIYNEVKEGVPELMMAYPFGKKGYKIKSEKTPYRTLTLEQLAMLYNCKCDETDRLYVDVFFLFYYLIGVNIGDLCLATKEQYHDGRFFYHRNKTTKLYSIRVLPEAKELIERYQDENDIHLIHVHTCARYENFTSRINKHLKKICKRIEKEMIQEWENNGRDGDKPSYPLISTYWARYTWSNVAHRIKISKDVISMALGHSFGNRTTDIYIDYDLEQVDEANKLVIEATRKELRKGCYSHE